MSLTKIALEVTEEDKVNCVATRGHGDGTVTLYYKGEDVPEVEYAPGAVPTEDPF